MPFRALLGLILIAVGPAAQAALTCADVNHDHPRYHENMDRLAVQARFPGNYWNRNQESAVTAVCRGEEDALEGMIDNGLVRGSVVLAIKEELGEDERSEAGRSYEYSRKSFSSMGLCSACADNVANHYVETPDSRCGQLARKAIEGQPHAIDTLKTFPDYCVWNYTR